MDTPGAAPSPTQRRVLVAVKRHGEATAVELATTLEISPSAVRQHLSTLRSAGLVEARPARGQPGRPADRYHATERTEPLFVTPGSDLSVELLGHIEEEDPALVDRIFDRRRRRLAENAEHELAGKSTDERVELVTKLLDAQGYLADFEKVDDDHYRINLNNCAIWTVARHHRQACTTELDFLRDVIPGATVERVTHKPSGAHACAYDITIPS